MGIIIRQPILVPSTDGIPEDFAAVRDYFNLGIANLEGVYRFVPRRTPITNEEIRQKWIPSADKNISLVAELNGKVVGSITAFGDLDSTAYEHRKERPPFAVGETVDPRQDYLAVIEPLIGGLAAELEGASRRGIVMLPIEDDMSINLMKRLCYRGVPAEHKPYREIGLSGQALQFELP
jgi:hypothetical protein